jgi:hypothetical protein
MALLPRESVDEDYASHCPAQAPWAGSSGSSADGTVFLLAGSRKDGLAPAREVGTETESCTGLGEGWSRHISFPGPSHVPCWL